MYRDKKCILIVDDSKLNHAILHDILSDNYEILPAYDGEEAILIISQLQHKIDLVLLDIVMPKMDGFEVLAAMNRTHWIDFIPVIMISAETSISHLEHAYDLGVVDYINRPFEPRIVIQRVKNTLSLYAKQRRLQNLVYDSIYDKEKNNQLMIEILSHIVEFRNGESGLHVLHIRIITSMLLKELMKRTDQYPLTSQQISIIINASALHDIGKIAIDEKILNKPGKLTPEEFEIIKTHSSLGAQMLQKLPENTSEELVQYAHDICRWHHERWDGNGYPDHLKGNEIPIWAQVVSLADVYDALTSQRVYKKAFSHKKAIDMILNGECGEFNPLLMECLLNIQYSLESELKIHSLGGMTSKEVEKITNDIIYNTKYQVNDRTIDLLDIQRKKYLFHLETTHDIVFDYDFSSKLLQLSSWSARLLGLNEYIFNPVENKAFLEVVPSDTISKLLEDIKSITIQESKVIMPIQIRCHGSLKKYMLVSKVTLDENNQEKVSFFGRLIENTHIFNNYQYLQNHYGNEEAFYRIASSIEHELINHPENDYLLTILYLPNHHLSQKDINAMCQHYIKEPDMMDQIDTNCFILFEKERHESLYINQIFNDFHSHSIDVKTGSACFPIDSNNFDSLFMKAIMEITSTS